MMKILITGIAGTLGREFAKLLYLQHEVTGYDSNEWAVAEFEDDFPRVRVHLGDFSEWKYLHHTTCNVIIHCAAFKHLPLGEKNVESFVDNNIRKTGVILQEARAHGLDFIFISSDKAVEPISLYGMTKAIGEYLVMDYPRGYIARCGNLIGSRGSVIPVWEKAVREGRPVKVTDMGMKRYVITPKDAARQIWGGYINGEKLIIPECEEVGMQELLHRANIGLYDIEMIGPRPKEKLREKLKWDWE